MTPELILKAGPRALTPDVPEDVRKVLAKHKPFRERATAVAREQQADMIREQEAVARANQGMRHKAVNGLGVKIGSITPRIYVQMMELYGSDCWDNPAFMNWFFKQEPACRVKTEFGTRGQEYAGRGR
jgi:hypothetical protein